MILRADSGFLHPEGGIQMNMTRAGVGIGLGVLRKDQEYKGVGQVGSRLKVSRCLALLNFDAKCGANACFVRNRSYTISLPLLATRLLRRAL